MDTFETLPFNGNMDADVVFAESQDTVRVVSYIS